MHAGGLIGVVHLPPFPGDPRHRGGGFADVESFALRDAEALAAGGVDAVLVENFGSAPFAKGTAGHRLPPHAVASMAVIARSLRDRVGLPAGVNCLRNDARAAVGIAAACALDFVRVNVHTGACATDQGIIEGEADRTLRYRTALGAGDVRIFADVCVKHGRPLGQEDIGAATRDAIERGLADAVIVTGPATGAAPDPAEVGSACAAAGQKPVLVGSGLTPENADALVAGAGGAIVGSWFRNGRLDEPVDPARVAVLVAALAGRFRLFPR